MASEENDHRAYEIFVAACDLPAEAQPAFVRSAVGDDTALLAYVEALLARDSVRRESDGADDDDEPLPERLGPYRVVAELARGGMGVVCVAIRDDEHLRRRVAIKLLRRGLATRQMVSRFRLERQVLAALSHPSIATLLDAGTADDGRPYLVMEYIEGEPLDRYCAIHELDVTGRIRVFLAVCDAVQHAHAHLIVHRDIKPANVLVTRDGVPKLLDFGIAKLLAPELSTLGEAATRPTGRLMTPEYSSPEQVRGGTVGIASDIYSLGVVLYELLVGRRPYDLSNRSPADIERVVCEQEPDAPSAAVTRSNSPTAKASHGAAPAVSSGRWRRRLAGDLDNIVLKALHKEPSRRYGTVGEFAADLRRHLDGIPVLARPDTVAYRTSRFVARHRVAVSLTTLVFVVVLASAILFMIQRDRAEQARLDTIAANTRLQRLSEQALDAFGRLLAAERASRGTDIGTLRSELLASAEAIEAALNKVASNERASAKALLSAQLHIAKAQRLGGVGDSLGREEAAASEFLAAERILRSLLEPSADTNDVLRGSARYTLATMLRERGIAAKKRRSLDEAESLLLDAISLCPSNDVAQRSEVRLHAASLADLAEVCFHRAPEPPSKDEPLVTRALTYADESVRLRRALFASAPTDPAAAESLASGLTTLGGITQSFEPKTALAFLLEAQSLYETALASAGGDGANAQSGNLRGRRQLAEARMLVAFHYANYMASADADARSALVPAIKEFEALRPLDPASAKLVSDLRQSLELGRFIAARTGDDVWRSECVEKLRQLGAATGAE